MAATPDGGGYWLVASDGGVFSFGNAAFHGSTGATPLTPPSWAWPPPPTAAVTGWWPVTEGFSFGNAAFHGSTGATPLNAPIVGMAATPDGGGYWLVASDGGVFSFGNATFHGSTGATPLNAPIVGMAATPDGGGYWLVASDGGVFSFGNAAFEGSAAGSTLAQPVIGMVRFPGGPGYWIVEGASLAGKVVTIDPGHNGGNGGDPGYINAPVWNGREEEACDTTGTSHRQRVHRSPVQLRRGPIPGRRPPGLRAPPSVADPHSNTGVGPCVTQRAAIGNDAHSDAAVAIHADGGPPGGRGFAVLEPVADGINNGVIASSAVLGTDLRNSFLAGTGEPVSSYDGVDGIQPRDDLGGINLTTVPKVFIECANMRNATDAALVVGPAGNCGRPRPSTTASPCSWRLAEARDRGRSR